MENTYEKYIGRVLDRRYRIDKIVGIGGMAVVFEAFDQVMDRTVAIKILKEEIADDEQAVRRFINESRAVAMMNHPNIVAIYDVTVRDDIKYIVMEFVRGITLKSYMDRKGVIGWKEAISYAEQILKALSHAHATGVVHRDIKPQNIMLLKNGVVKVTDFGIAKLPNAETVTMTDKAIGTVYYISPEQASGKPIDARSDLYSLGAMLYEMVTGQLPFNAESPVSVALMQVNDEPEPPRSLNDAIPKGLEQIILRAMEKQPEYRYQTADEMLGALQHLRSRPDTVFSPHKPEEPEEDTSAPVKKKHKKKKRRGSTSMLPVIAGVATAFMIAGGVSILYITNQVLEQQEQNDYTTIEVENFVGKTYSETLAEGTQNASYYRFTVESVYNADYPENTVISQEPAAGEYRKVSESDGQYCEITLTVSKGKETFTLADLTTQEYRSVELLLERMGLKYQEQWTYHDTVLEGYVYATSPEADATVTSGDTITLYISKGQEIEYVTVPDFTGKSKEDAVKLLIEDDLALGKVIYVKSDLPVGIVIAQSKPKNAQVPKSATKIDFTVSGGPNYGEETEAVTEDSETETETETEA